jgi:hypothetical protein
MQILPSNSGGKEVRILLLFAVGEPVTRNFQKELDLPSVFGGLVTKAFSMGCRVQTVEQPEPPDWIWRGLSNL